MAVTNFYMGGGSNLNAGSTAAASPVYSSTSGAFDGTSVYTPSDGQTTSSLVSIGDWASIFPTANATTPAIAQVTAVGAGVNGTITVSTTVKFGTLPGAVACKCRTGGAWADFGMVASGVALNTGTVPLSTQINIVAGTYTNTSTSRVNSLAGSATASLIWSGYKTAINDQDTNLLAVAGTDIPTITFTTGTFSTGAHQVWRNIDWTGASATGQISTAAAIVTFSNCRFTNTNAVIGAISLSSAQATAQYIGCFFKTPATATKNVSFTTSVAIMVGCYVGGGIVGVLASTSITLIDCVFDTQAGDAIQTNNVLTASGLSIYNPTGNGINWTTPNNSLIHNCYFESVAGASAINNTSGTNTDLIRVVGCAFFNCTSNRLGVGDFPAFFDNGTLASAGFNNPASDDFTPKTVLQGIGFPAHIPTFSPTSYQTPGAMAAQAGTGTTNIFQVES